MLSNTKGESLTDATDAGGAQKIHHAAGIVARDSCRAHTYTHTHKSIRRPTQKNVNKKYNENDLYSDHATTITKALELS